MQREVRDSIIVITGASSGIGRATALAFAQRGATVVLGARNEGALGEVAAECERLGGRALALPMDVTNEGSVQELARRAVETFGRLDVWINNAAVTLFAPFEEAPLDVYRRVIETNLFGYIHGARAALRYFREQGSGVLINNASVVATMPQPYTSAYTLTKHAIRALSMSLRQELVLDGAKDIHVCTVMPATVDTPLFQHAANYTGRAVKAMPPVYPAEQVAETMVRLVEKPQREVFVGGVGRMINIMRTLAPGLAERMFARQVDRQHLSKEQRADPTPGNVFEPMGELTGVDGGWHGARRTTLRRAAPFGAAALGLGLLARSRSRLRSLLPLGYRRPPSRLRRLVEPVGRAIGR